MSKPSESKKLKRRKRLEKRARRPSPTYLARKARIEARDRGPSLDELRERFFGDKK